MSRPGPVSQRAIILAPNGRDAEVAVQILKEASIPSEIRRDLPSFCDAIIGGSGLGIISDEAIRNADLRPLTSFLNVQPPWSDFPIILLTQRGGGPERNPAAARLAEALGNVTFLERPFHPTTLLSVVRTAMRGRQRQYEARSRLEDLGESERRLQTAMTAGRFGSWTLYVQERALHVSEQCRAHFGRRPDQPFDYDDLLASIHPEDRARMRAAVERTLATGDNYAIEYRNIWPDGTTHWVDIRARALPNKDGRIEQLVGVSSDITERKTSELEREHLLNELSTERAALSELTATLEERVRDRTAELMTEVAAREKAQDRLLQSQKMETMGQLTGGVAHDFNNLLMAVMGNLDLLRKRLPDDPRTRRLIEGAMQGARRGAALTQRMLAFARQQELKTASADLASLMAGMRELLDRSLGPQIELAIHAPSGLPLARVDAGQVELAILNLAINARDAMPGGGRIDIIVDQVGRAPDEPLDHTGFVRVRVSDTGTGMDAETLKKAIEPFFSTKPPGKGTGLGLSMVDGLAVQLGGRLELSSSVGKGTTASLWLPVADRAAPAEVEREPYVASARSATILVVDDDPLVARGTVDMLEDLGHTVFEANSARRALEILDQGQEFDLMMTDQAMPGMTGAELAEIVKQRRPHLPILLATGYADLPTGQGRTLPRLSKPYLQSQLQEHVDRLLAGRDLAVSR
jgi:PAS domain S-box-containing protein